MDFKINFLRNFRMKIIIIYLFIVHALEAKYLILTSNYSLMSSCQLGTIGKSK